MGVCDDFGQGLVDRRRRRGSVAKRAASIDPPDDDGMAAAVKDTDSAGVDQSFRTSARSRPLVAGVVRHFDQGDVDRSAPVWSLRRLRTRRRLAGSGIPGRRPGEGTGLPKLVSSGRTPAQVSRRASTLLSSLGGPLRTFTEASPSGKARIAVALSSLALGWRTSSQRPGIILSVKAANARTFSVASSTGRKRPRTTAAR